MYIEVRSFCKKKQSARRKVQPKSTFCYIWFLHTLIYQRKFSSKFSELGTNVQGHSFHPAITIMSSWQQHFVIACGSKTSATRTVTGVLTLSGAKPYVFQIMWRQASPKYIGSLFPQVRASLSTKSAQDCSESSALVKSLLCRRMALF